MRIIIVLWTVLLSTGLFAQSSYPQYEELERILGKSDLVKFEKWATTFSPHYSNIGIPFMDGWNGSGDLCFHIGRQTKGIAPPFIETQEKSIASRHFLTHIEQDYPSKGSMRYAFYDYNALLVEAKGQKQVAINLKPTTTIPFQGLGEYAYTYQPWTEQENGILYFYGYMANKDKRDPDPFMPILIGIKAEGGKLRYDEAKSQAIIEAEGKKPMLISVVVSVLDLEKEWLTKTLAQSPKNMEEAIGATKKWYDKGLGELQLKASTKAEEETAAYAALGLLMNAAKSSGLFAGRTATYPSRGKYPVEFLWDACFQNLAYEYMDSHLATDAMLILTENQRKDGKMGQYVTATHLRPLEVQVPLVGWASERLFLRRNDKDFARQVLYPLCKNNEWLLENRMTKYGLIAAVSHWELWDDSPRLDDGAIIACDFNGDLLLQMEACATMARAIGDTRLADQWDAKAKAFAQKMVDQLWNEDEKRFDEVHLESGERKSLMSPANFVPLLCDLPLSEAQAKTFIEGYLLNPDKFYGKVPFPSVAYDEESYRPGSPPGKKNKLSWRGATWMPMAWMMLEVLQKYGYEKEYKEAANRIYDLMVQDRVLSELFNSETGEGIGTPQCGWTCAIFLKLKQDLGK